MLIIVFLQFQCKGHQEPHDKVDSLSMAEDLEYFAPGAFWM